MLADAKDAKRSAKGPDATLHHANEEGEVSFASFKQAQIDIWYHGLFLRLV